MRQLRLSRLKAHEFSEIRMNQSRPTVPPEHGARINRERSKGYERLETFLYIYIVCTTSNSRAKPREAQVPN
jgi:hypothetical protein